MTPSNISERVLRFLAEHIDAVPQLEGLLLLREHEDREWNEEEFAARIYVSTESAREILRSLQRRRLIKAQGTPPRYRYGPQDAADLEVIAELASEYRRHLVQIATFIHAKAPASVREFARAFDLMKDR